MSGSRKIFIGSSREYLEVAKRLKEVIENVEGLNMEAVLWNTNAFPPGMTLVEVIENMPFEFEGAVLLWTPDVSCRRDGHPEVKEPVANIVFEYGYLAARLTRKRVAICRFENAHIPSDLHGVKFIEFPDYAKTASEPLPHPPTQELRDWVKALPVLAGGLPPTSQVHGYSGIWNVQNRFTLWRGHPVDENDQIYFDGKTFLMIDSSGKEGTGIQVGRLHIFVENYTATYEILNEILKATVDEQGILRLRVKVIRRQRIEEYGEPPNARFHSQLANKEFDLVLNRSEKPMRLEGGHEYKMARIQFQIADETYEYHGLFNPPSL